MTLAKRLIEAREKANLTQSELAEKVGIRQQSIYQIEDGKTQRPRFIERIADILNVSASWLLFGREDEVSYSLKIKKAEWEYFESTSIISIKFPDNYFSLVVEDNSMENNVNSSPTFPKDTIIIIDPNQKASPGKCVIARPKNNPGARPIFRLYKTDFIKDALIPLNVSRFYDPYPAKDFDILGVVIASMNLNL